MGRLSGKTAIITGGSSGLGAASVRRFVTEGAYVAIVDMNELQGEALSSELGKDQTLFIRTDVGNRADVLAMVSQVVDWRASIDILFNNAGIIAFDRVEDMEPDTWDRVIAVDLTGLFLCCRAALPHMARPGGVIINMASVSGLGGEAANPAYNAAKGGVINFTRSLAVDYGADGIRVNAICPGIIETPGGQAARAAHERHFMAAISRIPLRRQGQPEEVADLALFLASDESSYINGTIIPIDGGITAAVGWPDPRVDV